MAWLPLAAMHPVAWALDNPDTPDAVAAFKAREEPLRSRWSVDAGGPQQAAAARAYAAFLDAELNQAYQTLLAVLPGDARQALVRAQRQWLAWRAAEQHLIDGQFTAQRHGSSAAFSRADMALQLTRQRVLTLLAYQQNQPAAR
ncbi:MAG: lysozyme inhibitor LprI family protein [Rubrivivax sp.]|jgi:uncharacterized protein YecT (DUF1311 family)|nr:lysozyme inhibitor LprI family protein [Rubrivivax sp.]